MSESWERTDGVVTIRPPQPGDSTRLVAGRDAEFHRFLGPGSDEPDPVACITVDGDVVGWVDHDAERPWLLAGEVNVGYNVFASHRGRGIGVRALQLLLHHLAFTEECVTATLLIDPANSRSQALAVRGRFVRQADLDGNPYFKRSVPPLTYRQGDVTIRRRRRNDLAMDLSGRDDEHIRWSWRPSEGEHWEAMTPDERRAHALTWLAGASDSYRTPATAQPPQHASPSDTEGTSPVTQQRCGDDGPPDALALGSGFVATDDAGRPYGPPPMLL